MKTARVSLVLTLTLLWGLAPTALHAQLYNTTLGINTLSHNTTGNYNLAIGTNSLYQNTTGNDNTTNGLSCMYLNTTGNYNTAIGFASLTVRLLPPNSCLSNVVIARRAPSSSFISMKANPRVCPVARSRTMFMVATVPAVSNRAWDASL